VVQVQIVANSPQPNGFSGIWRTTDGTATLADNDYVFATGDFIIPPGQSASNPISIQIVGDLKVEANETFAVELVTPVAGTTIDPGPYPIRIINDDVATLSVSSPSVNEGNSGTSTLAFFVTLGAPAATTVTAAYTTVNGTATAGVDYQAASGTLAFAPGEVTKVVNVTVNGDTLFEANESFLLSVTPAGGFTASGTGTIVNDDLPAVSVSSAQVTEGNAGTTLMTFTITLPAPAPSGFQVAYSTVDGTAKAGEDYQATGGTLTFVFGDSRQTVSVPITGDTLFEPDETFTLNVIGPAGVVSATGTILNDDSAPVSAIRIVSGNGQRGRLGQALPQPLVVEVLDSLGKPVPGIAVRFRVLSGAADLAPATQTTDAQGRARTTVTFGSVGAVEVEAGVTGVGAVVFTLASETLFESRATGPVAKPIARALDAVCSRNELEFASTCRLLSLLDDGQLTPALEQIAPLQSGAQSKVTGEVVSAVTRGIASRLQARRSGVERFSVQKLSLSISGQPMAIGSLAMAAMQSQTPAAAAEESDYNGWSGFLSGNLGDGERIGRDGAIGFDLKSRGLMAGVDRAVGDTILGLALNVMNLDADFNAGAGSLDTNGYALSVYGSRSFDRMHLDGSLTLGRNRFDAKHIVTTVGSTARSENDANLFALTAGTGFDAHRGRTEFDLTLAGTYSRADIDDLSEEGNGPLILFVEGHEIESALATAGLNVRSVFAASFGDIIPSVRGEMIHELKGGARLVTARFLRDRLNTAFTVPVDRPDASYGKLSAGLQAVFPRGLSMFIEVTQDVLRSDLHFRNVQFNVSKSF